MSQYSSGFYATKREHNLSKDHDEDYLPNKWVTTRLDKTNHAQTRAKQRGVDGLLISLIERFGESEIQKGGTESIRIPTKLVADLRRAIESANDVSLVFNPATNKIITVQHDIKKRKRL